MPFIDYGANLNFSPSRFTKLKSKGDKIQFRLIGVPYYDGKHFLKEGDEWNIIPCPRINDNQTCDTCELFFKVHASAKKDSLDQKATQKLTEPFKASISFYFPVINRETKSFEVFQTTKSVRDKIENEIELGTKIMDRDIIVMRTEKPGTDYYSLSIVDSADTKELTQDELDEVKKGKATDLSTYINGKAEDDSAFSIEVNTEIEDDVDF